jgi:hypothetical protein
MIDGNISVSDVIGSNINAKIPWICEGFEWSIKTCLCIQNLKITCYTVKFKTGSVFEFLLLYYSKGIKRKLLTVMVNNSSNINKTNNYLSPHQHISLEIHVMFGYRHKNVVRKRRSVFEYGYLTKCLILKLSKASI